jgi:hypothetical protein
MLVVNIFGGPGVGKSTVAAGVFYRLKQSGHLAELVTEYAKDLTWENRDLALQNQPSLLGEQHARLWRLRDKVDLVVTDSPLLLSVFYNQGRWAYLPALAEELHNSYQSINYFLVRDPARTYDTRGRNQTREEAEKIDVALREILRIRMVPVTEVSPRDEFDRIADRVSWILTDLEGRLDGD